jgi:hypothetical protein
MVFFDHLGFMALTGNILGKQHIPLSKPPFIAAPHLNFSRPSRERTYLGRQHYARHIDNPQGLP